MPPHDPAPARGEAREDAILTAALELLAETGYADMSMDAIAARARSSKATIYRRWPGKARSSSPRPARRDGRHARAWHFADVPAHPLLSWLAAAIGVLAVGLIHAYNWQRDIWGRRRAPSA